MKVCILDIELVKKASRTVNVYSYCDSSNTIGCGYHLVACRLTMDFNLS